MKTHWTWNPTVVERSGPDYLKWNYSCGYCQTIFMGVGCDKNEADAFGKRHAQSCIWIREWTEK